MNKKQNWIGQLDKFHTAWLNFNLHRVSDDKQFAVPGIIDTGFTGFVQIPTSIALPLGLLAAPNSIGTTFLANGAEQKVILKNTKVTVDGETHSGYCQIPLTGNCPTLIGMDFLRIFGRMLIVSYNLGIHLVPEKPIT